MITYQEYLDGLISINLRKSMRREDYYKKYMANTSIRESYDQLRRLDG